jgi:hypothetical protein
MKAKKIDKVEKAKRIRVVMEWILEGWPSGDIINQIISKWAIEERQAKRYLADAREEWSEDDKQVLDHKRRQNIAALQRLKRTLKEEYKGTPKGMRAILAIQREIISLEGIRPATKFQLANEDDDKPFKIENTSNVDYEKLTTEVLEAIVKARKKTDE